MIPVKYETQKVTLPLVIMKGSRLALIAQGVTAPPGSVQEPRLHTRF